MTTPTTPISHLNRDPRESAPRRIESAGNAGVGFARPPERKKFEAKGHDRQLQDAQLNGLTVDIVCMDDDENWTGIISKRDKFTITMLFPDGSEAIFYKHAIKMVKIDRPRKGE